MGCRGVTAHYHRKEWPQRTIFSLRKNDVLQELLITLVSRYNLVKPFLDPRKMLIPPLHIKLGLVKQIVTSLEKESAAFKYPKDLFPTFLGAKVKTGILVRP